LQGNVADAKQQYAALEAMPPVSEPAVLFDRSRLAFALGDVKTADKYLEQLQTFAPETADLTAQCQQAMAQFLWQQEQQLRSDIRQWNQAGMEHAQAGQAMPSLALLRQAFLFMPCNAALVLNLLQALSQLPANKALQPLAKSAMAALEFSTKTAANQQRLAQLLTQLPETYLN
jgi:hypothetical protein